MNRIIPGALCAVVLAGTSISAVHAATDFTFAAIGKQAKYDQFGSTSPTLSSNPYRFGVIIAGFTPTSGGAYTIGSSTLTGASAGSYTLSAPTSSTIQSEGNGILGISYNSTKYSTLSSFDAAFPNVNYTLRVNTADNVNPSFTFSLSSDSDYPGAPNVTNLASLQSVNANSLTTIDWTGFTNGSISDFISFGIANQAGQTVYQSPFVGQSGALDGTTTSDTIAAGILQPGQVYDANITFVHIVGTDSTTYSGAEAAAFYSSSTNFTITTTPEPAAYASLLLGAVAIGLLPRRVFRRADSAK